MRTFEKIRNYEQIVLQLKKTLRKRDKSSDDKSALLRERIAQYEELIEFEKASSYA